MEEDLAVRVQVLLEAAEGVAGEGELVVGQWGADGGQALFDLLKAGEADEDDGLLGSLQARLAGDAGRRAGRLVEGGGWTATARAAAR
ncbi:hypothetical protein ACFV19_06835 [Streptomyces griseoluteus]|uniref:hypothetical protein n=1 Tax=Streptomyces griseoluteus TaxID=29306 RepID=UPI003680A24C